jgi:hypothetical protein
MSDRIASWGEILKYTAADPQKGSRYRLTLESKNLSTSDADDRLLPAHRIIGERTCITMYRENTSQRASISQTPSSDFAHTARIAGIMHLSEP